MCLLSAGALQSNKQTPMKIKMLSTQKGSINGIQIATYEAESVHDLSASKGEIELAQAFVGSGMAEVYQPDETKAIEAAPENKMMKRTYTRKAK